MRDFCKLLLFFIITLGLPFVIGYSMHYHDEVNDKINWNNGYCICGGKWKYSNTNMINSRTRYYFKCDKCNDIVVFTNKVFVKGE